MRPIGVGLVLATLLLAGLACSSGPGGPRPTVRVGSTNFSEQIILAELFAQALQARGYPVERRFNLGNREVVAPQLEAGQIDVVAEYISSYLTYLTRNQTPGSPDPRTGFDLLNKELGPRRLVALDFAAAQDTNGFAMTRAGAERVRARRLSDLRPVAGLLVLGGPPECPQRPFCLQGLKTTYDLTFKEFKALDAGGPLTLAALESGLIDVGLVFTTDPLVADRGLVLLEDDKRLQLAENVVPVVRQELLERSGSEIREVLTAITRQLTTAELTNLNRQATIERIDPAVVADAWLRARNIVR